jgi:Fic family protein
VRSLVGKNPSQLSARDILSIYDIILKGIDDENSGHYRSVTVRIPGSTVVLPNPSKVPDLMDNFIAWLNIGHNLHPIELAGEVLYRLVTIHPFVNGNGRIARLLMNLLLMMHGYPPAIIRKQDRLAYISSLEKAQLGGSKDDYEEIIIKAVDRSLDIYLKAAQGESIMDNLDTDNFLKIGELAKAVGMPVPTIRHWTNEGLLEAAEFMQSGYQLYAVNMVNRCKQIKKLKDKRLTLAEIKQQLS